MKKLIVAIVFTCSILQLAAQTKVNMGLSFDPILTTNKAEMKTDGLSAKGKFKPGINIGFMADFMFNDKYGFSTGLRYSLFNTKYEASSKTGSNNITIHKQYVQIPLGLKMKTAEVGYLKYFGMVGLIPSINVKTTVDEQITYNNVELDSSNLNDWHYYRKFNLFAQIGAGLEYNFGGNTSLMVGLSYEPGLINMARQNQDFYNRYGYYIDLRDKAIVLNLGLFF
jgi:hypothetical protein